MERVDALSMHIEKLADVAGVTTPDDKVPEKLTGVTNDVDVIALTKDVVDLARDLDHYFVSLLSPPGLSAENLEKEIAELAADLKEKKQLKTKALTMVVAAEEKFSSLNQQQVRSIYNPPIPKNS